MKLFLVWSFIKNVFQNRNKWKRWFDEAMAAKQVLINANSRLIRMCNDRNEKIKNHEALIHDLRKLIEELAMDSPNSITPHDWQFAYIPIYEDWPFPKTFSDAQVLAAQTSPKGAQAIVRVVFYTGQMDE